MAKNNIFDIEFFDELDKQINLTNLSSSAILFRQVFGALYAYYKFSKGKVENIVFMEKILEGDPFVLHPKWIFELIEVAFETTVIDKDRLEVMYETVFKPNILHNWKNQIAHNDQLKIYMFSLLMKFRIFDKDIWDRIVSDAALTKRVRYIKNFDKILFALNWYNNQKDSPGYQQINKEIETFKKQIKESENKNWKYDADV